MTTTEPEVQTLYTFRVLTIDPDDRSNWATNVTGQVYALEDVNLTTPLPLWDRTGTPIPAIEVGATPVAEWQLAQPGAVNAVFGDVALVVESYSAVEQRATEAKAAAEVATLEVMGFRDQVQNAVEQSGYAVELAQQAAAPGPAQIDAVLSERQIPQRLTQLRTAVDALVFNAADFGMSAASSDNTAALQAALTAAGQVGGTVLIPRATAPYVFDSPTGVTIPSRVTLRSDQATLTTSRNAPLLVVAAAADLVTVEDVTVVGSMPTNLTAAKQNQAGIQAYAEASAPITNLQVRRCRMLGVEGTAIRLRNVRRFRVQDNDITHHGYAAIGCHSVTEGIIEGNEIEGTRKLPGYSANTYGIYVSTLESAGPVGSISNPRSTDVMVRNNKVRRQAWSCLDTHVGRRISFIGNQIFDCPAYAINCVYIGTSGADGLLAPQDITIEGNSIVYDAIQDTSTLLHTGILMRGSIMFSDPARERVTGVIRGNVIRRMGRQDDSNSGAIFLGSALGVVVDGNTMHECRSTGVQVRDSLGTVVSNNTFVDLWRSTGQATAVYVRLEETAIMDVTVVNNKFVRGRLAIGTDIPAGASVNNAAISGTNSASIVTTESGNEWGNATNVAGVQRTQKTTATRTVMDGTGIPTGPKPDGRPWLLGDRVENVAPVGGAPMGWVCTNGGSPGAWRAYGQIA